MLQVNINVPLVFHLITSEFFPPWGEEMKEPGNEFWGCEV